MWPKCNCLSWNLTFRKSTSDSILLQNFSQHQKVWENITFYLFLSLCPLTSSAVPMHWSTGLKVRRKVILFQELFPPTDQPEVPQQLESPLPPRTDSSRLLKLRESGPWSRKRRAHVSLLSTVPDSLIQTLQGQKAEQTEGKGVNLI